MKFTWPWAAVFVLFTVHAILLCIGAYDRWPNIDIPMHLSGGFTAGMMALAVHRASKVGEAVWWERALFVVGFVALTAVCWEFYEFAFDAVLSHTVSDWTRSQLSLPDTMGDLLCGLLGGIAAFLVFFRLPKTENHLTSKSR